MNATSFTQHENASVAMFHHMLEKNQHVRDEFERLNLSTEEHGKFVADLIMGKPGEKSPQVSILLHSRSQYLLTIHHWSHQTSRSIHHRNTF